MDYMPADEAERRAAMQAGRVARMIRPEDVTRLTELLRVTEEVSESNPKDAQDDEREQVARELVTETGKRLKVIADVCGPDEPILRIKEEWTRFFKLDNKAKVRAHFRVLQRSRIRAVIELAERVRRLLAAKCPEPVDVDETAATVVEKAATVVHERDDHRLENLVALLNSAVGSSFPDPTLEEKIRDVVSKIWGRLLEESEDPTLQELLPLWQGLYQFDESHHMQVEIQGLVRDEDRLALALAQETKKFLGRRRPDGA